MAKNARNVSDFLGMIPFDVPPHMHTYKRSVSFKMETRTDGQGSRYRLI